jgi:hypothetical protein
MQRRVALPWQRHVSRGRLWQAKSAPNVHRLVANEILTRVGSIYTLLTLTKWKCDLKKLKFGWIYLKNSGRPVPNLNIVYEQKQYKNKAAFTRRFNKSVYKKRRGYVVLKKQIPFSVLCAYCLVETISGLKKVCVWFKTSTARLISLINIVT